MAVCARNDVSAGDIIMNKIESKIAYIQKFDLTDSERSDLNLLITAFASLSPQISVP